LTKFGMGEQEMKKQLFRREIYAFLAGDNSRKDGSKNGHPHFVFIDHLLFVRKNNPKERNIPKKASLMLG